jgi:hypothetical protein
VDPPDENTFLQDIFEESIPRNIPENIPENIPQGTRITVS